jgi:hypothetical protein
MHEPSHDPPPPTAVLAAMIAAAQAGLASAAGFLHSCLWPPCFQWTFWHAAEQYITPLHLAQRCNPCLVHPPLAHLGASRGTSSARPLPDIAVSFPCPLDVGERHTMDVQLCQDEFGDWYVDVTIKSSKTDICRRGIVLRVYATGVNRVGQSFALVTGFNRHHFPL